MYDGTPSRKLTIRDVKRRLAEAFPDVEFTYGVCGRGHARGHGVSWVGGPSEAEVRVAADGAFAWRPVLAHACRHPTPAESEELQRQWAEQDAARIAAEPARRAAAKAAGKAKAAATRAETKARQDRLAAAFPGIVFAMVPRPFGKFKTLQWTDGPDVESVAKVAQISDWLCERIESPAGAAARLAAERARAEGKLAEIRAARFARRLDKARKRARHVMRGIARRSRLSAQLWLPGFVDPRPVRRPTIAFAW